jgi:protein ImuB
MAPCLAEAPHDARRNAGGAEQRHRGGRRAIVVDPDRGAVGTAVGERGRERLQRSTPRGRQRPGGDEGVPAADALTRELAAQRPRGCDDRHHGDERGDDQTERERLRHPICIGSRAGVCNRTYVRIASLPLMLVGVHIPRFDLAVAAHEHGVPVGGAPLALAPLDGGAGPIGEVSTAAAAAGVRPGMRTAQAHALCPALRLVPPDPLAVRLRADRLYIALEGIGAAVEPVADGLALLDARPLERLWNGLDGVLCASAEAAARETGLRPRLGAAPGRFLTTHAARRARPGKPLVIPAGQATAFLADLPVAALGPAGTGAAGIDHDLLTVLEGLGIRRLRDLAALPAAVVRDRFGYEGQRAWLLAAGHDSEQIAPRAVAPALREMLALGEPIATEQAMAHAVRLLLDRLLARPERAGRAPRSLRVGARLAGGGSWEEHVPLREPSSDRKLLEMVATPRLIALGAPVDQIAIELAALTDGHRQGVLLRAEGEERRERRVEAVRQVRAAVGRDAALRVVEVAPDSRLPERRYALAPDEQ